MYVVSTEKIIFINASSFHKYFLKKGREREKRERGRSKSSYNWLPIVPSKNNQEGMPSNSQFAQKMVTVQLSKYCVI